MGVVVWAAPVLCTTVEYVCAGWVCCASARGMCDALLDRTVWRADWQVSSPLWCLER